MDSVNSVMTFIVDNSSCMYAVGIVVTILALAVSTRYSIRNLFNINSIIGDDPASETSERSREEICDVAGNDGDDEADEDEPEESEPEDDLMNKNKQKKNKGEPNLSPRYPDPVDYCEHIQGEIKRVKQSVAARTIEKELSAEQLQQEREVQQKQLADIFRLMQEQQERFGINSMDDMQEQMRLYAV